MLFEGSDKTSPRLLPAKRVEKTNFNQKRLKRLCDAVEKKSRELVVTWVFDYGRDFDGRGLRSRG